MSGEARATLDGAMTETQLTEAVVEMAERLGWRVAHIPDRLYALAAKEKRFDAMRGAKGLPDLIMVRKGWMVFAELKAEAGELEAEQVAWRDDIRLVQGMTEDGPPSHPEDSYRVTWHLWKPSDYSNGTIESVLR